MAKWALEYSYLKFLAGLHAVPKQMCIMASLKGSLVFIFSKEITGMFLNEIILRQLYHHQKYFGVKSLESRERTISSLIMTDTINVVKNRIP